MGNLEYVFRLDRMLIDFQRGKQPDKDIVTFGVQVGTDVVGSFISRHILSLSTGDSVQFSDFPPTQPDGAQDWEIGPVQIPDDDIVSIMYTAVNTSDIDFILSPGDQAKVAIASGTSIAGVAIAIGTGAETAGIGAAVGALVAGVGAVLGELVGDLIPDRPKCNGVVFAEKIGITGADLARKTATSFFSNTVKTGNPDQPKECGHPPEVDVTFSVRRARSVRQFLQQRGNNPSEGLRHLGQIPFSMRKLMKLG